MIEVTKVKLHPNNVKKHPKEQINNLVQLIKWVGFKDPIVLDKDNNLKAGHGRLLAAEKLEMTEVPYIRLEGLTKKQMDLFIYMDNQINESPWIEENVELLLQEIPTKDLELFELDWDGVRKPEYKEETEPIPEPPVKPKSKLGDIYQLGNHRIMCGDSTTDKPLLLNEIEPDIILSDPPYSSGGFQEAGKKQGSIGTRQNVTIQRDNLSTRGYLSLIKNVISGINADVLYLFTDWRMWSWTYDVSEQSGFPVRNMIVWDKMQMGMGFPWRSTHELILFAKRTPAKMMDGKMGNVLHHKRSGNKNHPTEKPVELLTDILKNTEGKIVYDPFIGSGSTLIACEQTNRICYGMELDPAYIDVIITRWENYTGKKAKLLVAPTISKTKHKKKS